MKKNYGWIVLVFFLASKVAQAGVVDVRILTTTVVKTFIFAPLGGTYSIYGDGKLLMECDSSDIFQMSISGDSVRLKTYEKKIGNFKSIKMISLKPISAFKIKSVAPKGKMYTYNDDLEVSIYMDKVQLLLINKVEMEDYIAGVVQSEVGKNTAAEYYKLQSILCRTYLLDNLSRHYQEGFGLCNDVHCQAYLGRSTEAIIVKAVMDTKGLVVVDNDLNLITAAFHSNCGGETCNSQDVWAQPKSYLKAIKDTFCLKESQAHWKRVISVEDWQAYISIKQNQSSINKTEVTSFSQNNGREIYFINGDVRIPLKKIRADFKLKSTFFSIRQEGDSLIFEGRGYGHGVGLCQQGAMEMSMMNKSYKDILHYYYKNVNLVDLSALNYFRKE